MGAKRAVLGGLVVTASQFTLHGARDSYLDIPFESVEGHEKAVKYLRSVRSVRIWRLPKDLGIKPGLRILVSVKPTGGAGFSFHYVRTLDPNEDVDQAIEKLLVVNTNP